MTSQRTAIATFYLVATVGTASGHPSYAMDGSKGGSIRGCGKNIRRRLEAAVEAPKPKVTWHQLGSSQEQEASVEEQDRLERISGDRDGEVVWTRQVATEASTATTHATTHATLAAAELNAHVLEGILHQNDTESATETAVSAMLLRIESASFADGVHSMDPGTRPNPRDISNAFHSDKAILSTHGASDWLWAFGQFLNHDLSEVNVIQGDFCNITVSPNDPFLHGVTSIPMSRSKFQLDESNVAQQMNEMTSFIDAESVYGTTSTRLRYIRSDDSAVTGRLRTSGNNLLPKNTFGAANRGGDDDGLFLAGDVRANENTALLVAHTLWLREHNYWADNIRTKDPTLGGDSVFEIARVMVRAIMQKIVYDEFLPALIGEDAIPQYAGYKEDVATGLENIVSSCAYRLGHTMDGDSLTRDYGNGIVIHLPLEEAFFAPELLEMHGLDPFLRGLATNTCEEIDPFLTDALRNHLFAEQFDLLALNIERARDHGIPDFNTIRESLGFASIDSFDDFLFSHELTSAYNGTDQIDCWIGMNAEPRLEGLMVGPTQQTVLARNFANIRDGDRYFYKNAIKDEELLGLIEGTTFAEVIKRNSDSPGSLDDIQGSVFFAQ